MGHANIEPHLLADPLATRYTRAALSLACCVPQLPCAIAHGDQTMRSLLIVMRFGRSTFAFSSTVEAVDGNLVITAPGKITAGRYASSTAVATFILEDLGATLENLCATTGVTTATGASTLTITQVAL